MADPTRAADDSNLWAVYGFGISHLRHRNALETLSHAHSKRQSPCSFDPLSYQPAQL